jgi:hypothetical protein
MVVLPCYPCSFQDHSLSLFQAPYKMTSYTRPADGLLCVVPENQPTYQALLDKADPYPDVSIPPASTPDTSTPIEYVRLYQKDKYQDDSAVYLQWTGNEAPITKLKEMLQYIYKNTDPYDIDLGDESYTLDINTDKKYSLNNIKGCQICKGVFTFPDEIAEIDYKTLVNEWDLGEIIMEFDTYSISEHFTPAK